MANHPVEMDFEIILSNSSCHEFGKKFGEKFGTIINFSLFPRKIHEQPQTGRMALG